jgi:hypothetical protein
MNMYGTEQFGELCNNDFDLAASPAITLEALESGLPTLKRPGYLSRYPYYPI